MAKDNELGFALKRYIVQRLACFDRPSEVAKAVKEDFQLEVSRQRVHYYDPTTSLGKALAPELKKLFEETRKAFLTDIDSIPIANKAVQLRALDRALALAEQRGQIPMIITLVETAAKVAGTITSKHEHDVNHRGTVKTVTEMIPADLSGLTNEQLTQLYREAATGSQRAGPGPKPTAH